ncbi:CsbD family protein [Fuerstiella marisgermanici]|uniref:CsbD-like protein n=1 Tax=Fuerstiella marisgermanici TaxID=1891926 RepID=A0A1P8WJD4_9PLAN|nr:CsbD family protein [Fuerstiella marisgermanici]APZ94172.1 CsbD-like protein [Fuerstiella marisgermanici]
MITQQELQGNWNELKGCLREKWGQLSDDDFAKAKGSVDRLIGTIQKRTGESKANVEAFLDSAVQSGASGFSQAAENIRDYASSLSEATHEQYDHAQEALAAGLGSATETVRRRPAESVAVCFGAGLIAGAVLGLILRNKA